MARSRSVSLKRYDLSEFAGLEMASYCRQYPEMKKQLAMYYDLECQRHEVFVGAAHGNPTEKMAMRVMTDGQAARLQKQMKQIETIAKNVAENFDEELLKNVTEGIPFHYLQVPCGQRQFYRIRQDFFYRLYLVRHEMGHYGDVGSC